MKKILIAILVLISVQSFGQEMRLYARRCNTNGTIDSIDNKLFTDSLFLRSNGQFVAHKREYYAQFFDPVYPIGFENFKQRADGIWENDNCTVNNTTIVPPAVETSLSAKLATNGNGSSLTGLTKSQVGLSNVDNTSDPNKPISIATQAALDGKQATLVSATNIKTVNGSTILGSGDLVVGGGAITTSAGVGNSPTASSTTTITHNLGRVPNTIRIYGYGTFTSNAAATATTSSMGVFNSSGNFCVYQRYGAAVTTTQAGLSSNVFAILLATGGGSFISGVIQNVTSTSFDIVWTETGTATAQVYLWEAQ